MRKMLVMGIAACIGLTGAATEASADLFSATGTVIAMLAEDLYLGEAVGHLNGAGTLAIHSQQNPGLTCSGQFTSSAELGGAGQLDCSDGSSAKFTFQRMSVLRGHGVGSHTRGALRFAYGLSAEEAGPYLDLPQGKKLISDGNGLKLADL
jgi:hypothetical protein